MMIKLIAKRAIVSLKRQVLCLLVLVRNDIKEEYSVLYNHFKYLWLVVESDVNTSFFEFF